jgi:antitoxin (DNA-binding transcriptional repressor) of toxin-antitoxin stability system
MKTASVREIRQNFPRVMQWIEDGEDVAVTMRRRVVARLIPEPKSQGREAPVPDFAAVSRKVFGDRTFADDLMAAEREEYRF